MDGRGTAVPRQWLVAALFYLLAGFALGYGEESRAQTIVGENENCAECHEDFAFEPLAHDDTLCSDCHVNIPATHEDADLEPLTDEEGCGDCHRRPIRDVGRSDHASEAACGDCHGDPHFIHEIADPRSAVSPVNQIHYCAECHDEPEDLVDSFLDSEHGHALLKSGLVGQAPSCTSCHGPHQILGADDPKDPTSFAKSPETCGSCHTLVLDTWHSGSAHGVAWDEGNEDTAVCTDCHGAHGVGDPAIDTRRLASPETCGGCHEQQHITYVRGFHGKAITLGMTGSAICADCHTPHQNLGPEDPASTVHPDRLMETCGDCHQGISQNFVSFDPHIDVTDPDDNIYVYYTYLFMITVLISVFGFFGTHDALWLQRMLVGLARGEYSEEESPSGQYVRRFSRANTALHVWVVIVFLALALTGLPLRFQDAPWAQQLINLFGGLENARVIHRFAGIGTFGYALFHFGHLFLRIVVRREKGMLWGPNSILMQPRDIVELFANLRYFLYLGKAPKADRWNYIEKFDYVGELWGVFAIGVSGLMLWFPTWFTQFFPGWVINAAYVVHSYEALLATGFIFVFHFLHTHLRPQIFPMDIVIFTGKMSLERFIEERPLEYERLVANGELEDYLVEAPTASERRRAYVFGSIALTIGLALAVGIITALLSGDPTPVAETTQGAELLTQGSMARDAQTLAAH